MLNHGLIHALIKYRLAAILDNLSATVCLAHDALTCTCTCTCHMELLIIIFTCALAPLSTQMHTSLQFLNTSYFYTLDYITVFTMYHMAIHQIQHWTLHLGYPYKPTQHNVSKMLHGAL